MLTFFKSLLTQPRFEQGVGVNLIDRGDVKRADGIVLAHTSDGVVIEWTRGGTSVEAAGALCRIG